MVFWARLNMNVRVKKKIWGVLLDPSDFRLTFIQLLFVVSVTVLCCLFCSLLCHACLNLHYILTSAERSDFSARSSFELLFDKSNQSQSSWIICQWYLHSGWNENVQNIYLDSVLNWGQLIHISYCQVNSEKVPVCNFKLGTKIFRPNMPDYS